MSIHVDTILRRVQASLRSEIEASSSQNEFPSMRKLIKQELTKLGKQRKKPLNSVRMDGAIDDVLLLLKKPKYLGSSGLKSAESKLSSSKTLDVPTLFGKDAAVKFNEALVQALIIR